MNMPNVPYRPNLWAFDEMCVLNNLTNGELDTVFDSNENAYVSLFKLVHCNPSRSNYHNMYYINNNKLLVFMNDRWYEKDPTQTMQIVIDKERDALINFLDRNSMLLSGSRYTKICDLIDSTYFSDNDDISHVEKVYYARKNIKNTLIETLEKYQTLHAETCTNIKNTCETISRTEVQDRREKIEELKKTKNESTPISNLYKEFYNFKKPPIKTKTISKSSQNDTDSKSFSDLDPNIEFDSTTESSF